MVKHSARLDATYAAIAHPVRRRILDRLSKGESTVSALAAPHRMSLVAVSKHIRVLESAGLVRRTIRGREHHLALRAAPLAAAAGWLEAYRAFWERRLDLLEARLREERRR